MRKRIEKDDIRRSESTRKFSGPSSGGSSARKPTKNFTDRSTGISQRAIGVGDLNFVHQSQDLLTGPKGNFQETVSASPIIQKENHMRGIDLTELFK